MPFIFTIGKLFEQFSKRNLNSEKAPKLVDDTSKFLKITETACCT